LNSIADNKSFSAFIGLSLIASRRIVVMCQSNRIKPMLYLCKFQRNRVMQRLSIVMSWVICWINRKNSPY